MAESEEELKSLLMKVKEENEKDGLKLNILKTKITASGPITSWQIDGETMETVRVYFFGLQNHCRWWLQPWNQKMLAPWKKSYDPPRQHIKKQRHYFANKGLSSQSYGFSSCHVWMSELTIKKAECQRIDAFELWCCRRLLRIPWTEGRSTQSILKEINPEHWLEGLMLKLQYFGHMMQRANSLEKALMLAGKDWRQEEKGTTEEEMLDGITDSMSLSILQKMVKDREAWHPAVHRVANNWTWPSGWTILFTYIQWNTTQQWKWNNAICSNIDVTRDHHTKSVKKRKTNTVWYHLYVESKIQHNEPIYKTETDS